MPELIRQEASCEQFSFQRASCGLDAGVHIFGMWRKAIEQSSAGVCGPGPVSQPPPLLATPALCVSLATDKLTLNAGVDGKRVDSTYDSVYNTLRGVTGVSHVKAAGEDEEGAQDDVAAAPGSQADAGKRRGKATPGANALDASATLADPASLREKRSDMTFENDPLFNRTTKLFDENSPAASFNASLTLTTVQPLIMLMWLNTRGLLLLNYPVYYNCTVLFDSCDRPMAAFPDLHD
ncbi:hypothetical protein QJQ45_023776, partial [Haematococcus lacustris]